MRRASGGRGDVGSRCGGCVRARRWVGARRGSGPTGRATRRRRRLRSGRLLGPQEESRRARRGGGGGHAARRGSCASCVWRELRGVDPCVNARALTVAPRSRPPADGNLGCPFEPRLWLSVPASPPRPAFAPVVAMSCSCCAPVPRSRHVSGGGGLLHPLRVPPSAFSSSPLRAPSPLPAALRAPSPLPAPPPPPPPPRSPDSPSLSPLPRPPSAPLSRPSPALSPLPSPVPPQPFPRSPPLPAPVAGRPRQPHPRPPRAAPAGPPRSRAGPARHESRAWSSLALLCPVLALSGGFPLKVLAGQLRKVTMVKYVAAVLLSALAGKSAPSAEDLNSIFSSGA